jgi:peptidoglycan/LPS O-acetylase OafA/YrhL
VAPHVPGVAEPTRFAEPPGATTGRGRGGMGDSASGAGKDPLLDLIRVAAIGRVVMWHTWVWPWLTWIPAMPAMFFVTGALLDGSLERRGWLATLRPRLRRLLIPYWAYAATCWLIMMADGWRPSAGDAMRWAVPLWDPVGSDAMPGLWVPLWYLRAYLWFLLAAGLIRMFRQRVGPASVGLAAAAAAGVWLAGRRGLEVPLAVGDAVTYLPFVLAGMGYGGSRRVPRPQVLWPVGLASAIAAVVTWQRFGPADGVVNRSYLLTMLVGMAGLSLIFAARSGVLRVTSPWQPLVSRVNSRALTIYLWHGLGLVAAQRLVDQRLGPGAPRAALAMMVVALVVVAAVIVVGPLEDRAAGRSKQTDRSDRSAGSRSRRVAPLRRVLLVVPGSALVVAALVLSAPSGAAVEAPLSGRAVVARGGVIEQELTQRLARVDVTGKSPQEVLDEWVAQHRDRLEGIGARWIDAAIARPDGQIEYLAWNPASVELPATIAWWSMSKVVTTAWLVQLVEEGVVDLDDPLSDHVPETPRSEDMTLRQLATHTAGIPSELDGSLFDANPAQEIRRFSEWGRLAYEPGEGYGYSRVGYYLLALALERASGVTWESAVKKMAAQAGFGISLDDDWSEAAISDPDGHGYRGGLWSAGGLISEVPDGAGFLRWLFTDGLSPEAERMMTQFPNDPDRHYYGLALIPVCPCQVSGARIESERYGLDTASGMFVVDGRSGASVMVRPEGWWDEEGPLQEFYDLQQRLLDSVAGGAGG